MNTSTLRRKRIVLPTATLAALGVGGVVWASTATADVQGSERDRVVAAVGEVVDGQVVDVDADDDDAGAAYEVEVRQGDGTEVELTLDEQLTVISRDDDDRDDDRDDDGDDRLLSGTERTSAEEAARGAVEGGTVTEVEASDDGSVHYEVDVRDAAGVDWDVDLADDFTVLSTTVDD